jgi:hypothetical protein
MPENAKYWRSVIAKLSCFWHGVQAKPECHPRTTHLPYLGAFRIVVPQCHSA